jgi:hypothetical protein
LAGTGYQNTGPLKNRTNQLRPLEKLKNIFFCIKRSSLARKLWSGFQMLKNKMASITIPKPGIYVWFQMQPFMNEMV